MTQPLSADDQARITALASDIPALWNAPTTTNADRKQILRCLVERVVVHVRCDSEYVDATIHWAGGFQSQHDLEWFRRDHRPRPPLRKGGRRKFSPPCEGGAGEGGRQGGPVFVQVVARHLGEDEAGQAAGAVHLHDTAQCGGIADADEAQQRRGAETAQGSLQIIQRFGQVVRANGILGSIRRKAPSDGRLYRRVGLTWSLEWQTER